MTDLDEVADELYAAAPEDFTEVRQAQVKEVRGRGDRELAQAVAKLRRPTVGAWLVNLLVRERPAEIQQLRDLGGALREAQAQLAGDELRRLAVERHRLVSAVVQEALRVGAEHGHQVAAQAAEEVTATLEAALADPLAAEAAFSGRLTKAVRYSGFGEVDLDVVATPRRAPLRSVPTQPASVPPDATTSKASDRAKQRELEQAARALREAEQAAEHADLRAREAEAKLAAVRVEQERAEHRVRELENELARARRDATTAAGAVRPAQRAVQESARAVKVAQRRLERARAEAGE